MNARLTLLCLATLLAGSLFAGGCAVQYSHSSRPEYLWDMDYDMCAVEVDYAVEFHHYSTTASRPMTQHYDYYSQRYKDAVRECMEAKGYLFEDDQYAILFGSKG